jgi:HEAT repeat protein
VAIEPVLLSGKEDSVQVQVKAAKATKTSTAQIKVIATAGKQTKQSTLRLTVERMPGALKVLPPPQVTVRAGGKQHFKVQIQRMDLEGPVQVKFVNVPSGITLEPVTIAAGKDSAEAKVEAAGDSVAGAKTVQIQAQSGDVSDKAALEVLLQRMPKLSLTLPDKLVLNPGDKKQFAVKIHRDGVDGPVTVRFAGMAAGITLSEVMITAGKDETSAEVSVAADIPECECEIRAVATAGTVKDAAKINIKVRSDVPVEVRREIKALASENLEERRKAGVALGNMGYRAKAAVPPLIETLKDKDAVVRRNAASALGKIGRGVKAVVPALTEALADKGPGVRGAAAEALGWVGPEAKAAVPALTEALKDKYVFVRGDAALALARIGSEAKAAVPALIETLKDKDRNVAILAGSALGMIAREDKAVVPALIEALKDKDKHFWKNTVATLSMIANLEKALAPTLAPTLIEALKDKDANVRSGVAIALGEMGPLAKSAVPALNRALKDENELVRDAAAGALKKINPP